MSVYEKLGLGSPKTKFNATTYSWSNGEETNGILQYVLVRVEAFFFFADFVILDYEVYFKAHIILESPFFGTGHVLVIMGYHR